MLKTAHEAELILEKFMCDTVLKNVSTSGLLFSAGVVVSSDLKSRELLAHEASIKVMEDIIQHRFGKERLVSVRHALGVAKYLGLKTEHMGDVMLLARATKSTWKFTHEVL